MTEQQRDDDTPETERERFLRLFLARFDAERVAKPADPFLYRWLTGRDRDEEQE